MSAWTEANPQYVVIGAYGVLIRFYRGARLAWTALVGFRVERSETTIHRTARRCCSGGKGGRP
jgi:hypothetical protein